MALRVALTRLLRGRPDRIALVIADAAHLGAVLDLLAGPELRNHANVMRQPCPPL
ncbi:hypothetical protein [Derxia lacustris]|uniref:hypothetical protein n=1 Tax=Derxia lacustris TaxID=764842 RepID=UPI001594ABC8|nr:hypothetical protein [Derxia lacustris]